MTGFQFLAIMANITVWGMVLLFSMNRLHKRS